MIQDFTLSTPVAVPLLERRITLRLVAYWERIRGARDMPVEDDIDPDAIPELWEDCFLLHTQDLKQEGYNYIYLGEHVAQLYAEGLSAGDCEGVEHFNTARLGGSFQKVIDTRKPVIEEGSMRNALGRTVLYRQCLLPLGSGGGVEAILGGIRYKLV